MKFKNVAAVLVVLCIFSCFVTPFVKAEENEITLRVNGIEENIKLVQNTASIEIIKYEDIDLSQNDSNKVYVYTVEDSEEDNLEDISINNVTIESKETIVEEIVEEEKDQDIIQTIVIPNNTGIAIEEIVEIYE